VRLIVSTLYKGSCHPRPLRGDLDRAADFALKKRNGLSSDGLALPTGFAPQSIALQVATHDITPSRLYDDPIFFARFSVLRSFSFSRALFVCESIILDEADAFALSSQLFLERISQVAFEGPPL